MHVWTLLSDNDKGKSGYGIYADGMMELPVVDGRCFEYRLGAPR
jgi:hypothetical protein